MKKHKIILIELIKPLTTKLNVYERELLSRQIVAKSGLQIATEPVCKTGIVRRIIQTRQITNKSILKTMVNNLKQANLSKCRISRAFILSLISAVESKEVKIPVTVTDKAIQLGNYLITKVKELMNVDQTKIEIKINGGI